MASKKKLKKQVAILEDRVKRNHTLLMLDYIQAKQQSDKWRNKYFDLLDTSEFNDGTK